LLIAPINFRVRHYNTKKARFFQSNNRPCICPHDEIEFHPPYITISCQSIFYTLYNKKTLP
jgi:hypothetical protein